MTDVEDDAAEIEVAKEEASEYLYFAILRFLSKNKEYNATINLIAMELALLTSAARLAHVLEEDCHAKSTRATFRSIASMTYTEVAKYRTKKRRQSKPKAKGHLSLVK